jgi:hypothetical protein
MQAAATRLLHAHAAANALDKTSAQHNMLLLIDRNGLS